MMIALKAAHKPMLNNQLVASVSHHLLNYASAFTPALEKGITEAPGKKTCKLRPPGKSAFD